MIGGDYSVPGLTVRTMRVNGMNQVHLETGEGRFCRDSVEELRLLLRAYKKTHDEPLLAIVQNRPSVARLAERLGFRHAYTTAHSDGPIQHLVLLTAAK